METLRCPPIAIKFDEAVRSVIERPENSMNPIVPDSVQLLRTGIFHHPQLGEIKVTSEMLTSMVHNFNEKVRGIDIAIDYKHESDDIAAGWIKELELSENQDGSVELWATVKWTPLGLKKLHEREFRYLSADFSMNYKDNESLAEFGPTLFGAGLTNRPVVKRMQPAVVLTELTRGNEEMTKEEIKKLQEDLEAEKEKALKLSEQVATLEEDKEKLEKEKLEFAKEEEPKEPEMSLDEAKATIAKLQEKIKSLVKAAQLSEQNKKFDELLNTGKTVEAQREAFINGDTLKFAELAGEVNLEGKGSEGETKGAKKTVEEKVLELAEKLVTEGNTNLGEAIGVVLSENEELRKEYEASFII